MVKKRKQEGHVATVKCPFCKKDIDVIKETEVIVEPVKGEKEVTYKAVKALQTSLGTGK